VAGGQGTGEGNDTIPAAQREMDGMAKSCRFASLDRVGSWPR